MTAPRVLAVFGGTGSVGREVVRQAVMAGNSVNVLSRSRARVQALHQPVALTLGDVTDAAVVDRTIASADAVISTLGHTAGGPADLLRRAMRNIIDAMDRHDVRRIVVLTNLSVRSPDDNPSARQQWTTAIARLGARGVDADHRAQAQLLVESDLDWTIVRAPMLLDRRLGSRYHVGGFDATIGPEMGRAPLAAFLLACALERRYPLAMPVVSQDPPQPHG